MKVYCFGNEFLKSDSLAKEIADKISMPGIEFIKCDSPEEIFLEEKEITILDVVQGIGSVIVIEDINQLKNTDMFSLHDFDLGFFLKLMKSMNQLEKVRIIGIPVKGDKEKIKSKVREILQEIFSKL
ncbi:hypothetical protein GF323_02855 [Candidatus Woesearchaeota archaeon]|nr:hypothetical protein [Candidatus Woesearchaeota archaeon]